jgi:hypothetical protein
LVPLENYVDHDSLPRMHRVIKIVLIIGVVDVDVVVIAPTDWPRINQLKPIVAVLESRPAFDDHGTVEAEMVFSAELLMKTLFRDRSVIGRRAPLSLSTPNWALLVITVAAIAILLATFLLFCLRFRVLLRLPLLLLASVRRILLCLPLVLFLGATVILLLRLCLIVLGLLSVRFRPSLVLLWSALVRLGRLPLLWSFRLPLLLGMFLLGRFLAVRLVRVRLLCEPADCTESQKDYRGADCSENFHGISLHFWNLGSLKGPWTKLPQGVIVVSPTSMSGGIGGMPEKALRLGGIFLYPSPPQ